MKTVKSLRAHGLELLLEKHSLDAVYSLVTDHKETIDNTYREIQKSKANKSLSDVLRNIISERDDAIVVNLYEADNPGIVDIAIKQLTRVNADLTMANIREWLRCYSAGLTYESPTENKSSNI